MRRLATTVIVLALAIGAFYAGRHFTSTTTTTSTTSTTVAPTTTTTSGNLATDCSPRDFSGAFVQGQGAAGTIFASVTLTKTTSGTCTMKGWPLLTLQDKLGAVLASRAIDVPTNKDGFSFPTAAADAMPATLRLAQGSITDFSLAYSDVPTGATACPNAGTLSVQFAPNGAAVTVTPSYPLQICNNGQYWVSPFY
ncbi:MAG: DUF4232 domain-containing protein [Acidobacteriota bacterium]|nr:DUF4232 domain-containing protein [Acidobacteriota bacterium]